MRCGMNEGKSYIPPVGIGEVMRALGVGQVVASNNPGFAVGDYANGALGVQDYFLGEPRGFYKVDPKLAPLPRYLSALGMTRSEEHTSEIQSLMRISYAVFCLKKKTT